MKTTVVLNPQAGAGRAGKNIDKIKARIESVLGPAELVSTEKAGDATFLTRNALQNDVERIVAVGGDGTNNEVINGFFDEVRSSPTSHLFGLVIIELQVAYESFLNSGSNQLP